MSFKRIASGETGLSRRALLQLSGGAAVLLLVGCNQTPSVSTSNTASSGEEGGIRANRSAVKAGYDNPNWSHHVADVVAREKGFFGEMGIDSVEIIIFDDAMTAIIGRGVEWTTGDTDAVIPAHVEQDIDVWWLGTRRDKEDLLFGLAPGVTVESLRGSGASVSGGEVGSRNELLGKMMVRELGLDPEADVTWITMGGGSDTRLAALINGNLSGSNIQIRHIAQLEAAGGTVVYNKQRPIAQDGYMVLGDFLEANRATVVAYLTGIIRAKQFLKNLDNKDEVIEIMKGAGYEFPQEFVDTYEAGIAVLSADCGFEIEQMDILWEELGATGEVAADMPWREAVNLEPLWEAQEANGLPRRPASL